MTPTYRIPSRLFHVPLLLSGERHWYETTCRLRCVFYVFFSLAVMMAIAMGTTTEIFFSLMATPPSEGLSFGVIVGVVRLGGRKKSRITFRIHFKRPILEGNGQIMRDVSSEIGVKRLLGGFRSL